MRRRNNLIALAALGALAIPVPSHAVEADITVQLIREVELTTQVRHMGTGKKGTLALQMRKAQGVRASKAPIYPKPDDASTATYLGEGVGGPAGLPEYSGCIDLKIVGVVTHNDWCGVVGSSATMDADPALATVGVAATFGPPDDYHTVVTLDLQSTDDPPTHESIAQTTETRPTTKSGGGYEFDLAQGIRREGIIVNGILFDESPNVNAIAIIPNTESVVMREFVQFKHQFTRSSLICASNDPSDRGFIVGNTAVHPDVFSPDNDDPDNLPQPGPDGQSPDYIKPPPGCYPDDQVQLLPVDLP